MAAPTYHCNNCGTRLKVGEYLFSQWTRKRYCTNVDECRARAKRRARKEA